MKITVKNFGPIKEAKDIKISPMTVFVGPSNTGKSYLAMLIYSIVKTIDELFPHEREVYRYRNRQLILAGYTASQGTLQKVEDVPSFCAQRIKKTWHREFARCLGEETENILKPKNKFSVQISDDDGQIFLDLHNPEKSKFSAKGKKYIGKELETIFAEKTAVDENDDEFWRQRSKWEVQRKVAQLLLLGKTINIRTPSTPYYLPAIRGGIMQSHRTIVSALIEKVPMAGLVNSPPIPMFNGVLSDFMQHLIRASYPHRLYDKEKDGISKIGKTIEDKIMEGRIKAKMLKNSYPDFQYLLPMEHGKTHAIPLMSASSMVSELAPVVIFIRHYLRKGSIFILEEPEAHLHPGSQREIASALVQLVHAGVKVIITTHSDNILEQIGNFIHASTLDPATRPKILGEEAGEQALPEEKTSVYLFKKTPKGTKTVVDEVKFSPDSGIITEDHQNVAIDLYNEAVELLNQTREAND